MKTIKGDLISLAISGEFDIIAHGCNCQGLMGAGIARQIKEQIPGAARADRAYKKAMSDIFGYYHPSYMLGTLSQYTVTSEDMLKKGWPLFTVLNLYTQVQPGANFDLENGLIPAIKKMNQLFKGKRVGFPMIGTGIGGGDWGIIRNTIVLNLTIQDAVFVEYEPKS